MRSTIRTEDQGELFGGFRCLLLLLLRRPSPRGKDVVSMNQEERRIANAQSSSSSAVCRKEEERGSRNKDDGRSGKCLGWGTISSSSSTNEMCLIRKTRNDHEIFPL